MMKNILAKILAVWALLTFMVTFLIIFIPSMISHLIPGRAGQSYFIAVAKIWMSIWLPMVGCPIRVRGKQYFDDGRTYVVACNHNSLMDIPLSSPFIPGPNKTIAKKSFARIPIFGWFYSKGSVLVDRKSDASRKLSYQKMKDVLAQGIHMCIYPEGTRNKTANLLGPFHSGAFRLALETKTAIIPGLILNTKKVLPADKPFSFIPHRLEFHFLPPIEIGAEDTIETLKTKTASIMEAFLKQHQK